MEHLETRLKTLTTAPAIKNTVWIAMKREKKHVRQPYLEQVYGIRSGVLFVFDLEKSVVVLSPESVLIVWFIYVGFVLIWNGGKVTNAQYTEMRIHTM
jgi:hypothetical protein